MAKKGSTKKSGATARGTQAGSTGPRAASAAARRARLFELFNEIGIIGQLATTRFNGALPDGLHVSHFSVLNHLVRLGDGRTPLAIAEAFQVSKATMTNTLARLGERGLVTLRPNPEDGRSKTVHLTEAGRAFRDEAIGGLDDTLDELAARLDVARLVELIPALAELRAVLDAMRDEAR